LEFVLLTNKNTLLFGEHAFGGTLSTHMGKMMQLEDGLSFHGKLLESTLPSKMGLLTNLNATTTEKFDEPDLLGNVSSTLFLTQKHMAWLL